MTSTPNHPDPIPAISIHRTHPLGDAALIGLRLIGAGLGATGLALIEGFARRGHLPGWAALHPRSRALVLVTHAVVAATLARGWRTRHAHREAGALEASAIAAWTLALVCFTEDPGDPDPLAPLGDLRDRVPADITLADLATLDPHVDPAMRAAVDELVRLADAQRDARRVIDPDEAPIGAMP